MDYDIVGTNDFLGQAWVPVAAIVMTRGIVTLPLHKKGVDAVWVRPRESITSSASNSPAVIRAASTNDSAGGARTVSGLATPPPRPPPPTAPDTPDMVAPPSPFLSMRSPSITSRDAGAVSADDSVRIASRLSLNQSTASATSVGSAECTQCTTLSTRVRELEDLAQQQSAAACTQCGALSTRVTELEESARHLEEHVVSLEASVSSLNVSQCISLRFL
jgi:hypothetical protein